MNNWVRAFKKYGKALIAAFSEFEIAPEPNKKQKKGPVCDVCLTEVGFTTGHLLTTQQVVSSYGYWEYAFKHQWAYYIDIDPDGKSLDLTIRQQVGQNSPWLICEKCVFFLFDKKQVRARLRAKDDYIEWQVRGFGVMRPHLCGPGALEDALKAASEGWERAFGKKPSALVEFSEVDKMVETKTKELLTNPEQYGIRRIVDGIVCVECPECKIDYNRKLLLAEIKKQSPFLFDSAGWTTKFICQNCSTGITISSSTDD